MLRVGKSRPEHNHLRIHCKPTQQFLNRSCLKLNSVLFTRFNETCNEIQELMVNIFDISSRVGTSIFELEIRTNILIKRIVEVFT